MNLLVKKFHEPQGLLYHGGALLYVMSGYLLGLAGLFSAYWPINLLATLWLAHAMTIAAYLIHECGHNTVFRNNAANARLGVLLNWVCGACYGSFENIRYKHFRHHMDNDDSVWFMYDLYFEKHPWVARLIQFFEWFYIPAHDLMMHGIMTVEAFVVPGRQDRRLANTLVIIVRGGLFLTILVLFPKAAILYMVAYMIMMNILRFMDSLQHDYGANPILLDKDAPSRMGGRATEQEHTFSNPLSMKVDWINWLTLNFGFHNAHHARPTVPWYRLPVYHREKFGSDPEKVIPFSSQLKIFHKYRVQRVLHAGGDLDGRPVPIDKAYLEAARAGEVYGGNAVSFLTSF
jgi:omega-6 fatty acid desaturase (delta-12 desaturase)